MEPDARARLVASLSPTKQRILESLGNGRASVATMQAHVGRADWLTRELDHLRSLGVIRRCGRTQLPSGMYVRLYELVPDAEIETEAAAYKPTRKRKSTAGGKLSELHRLRKGMSQSRWDTFYLRVLELTHALVFVSEEEMTSWECAPTDEIDRIREALVELHEWCDNVLSRSVMRLADDEIRSKIEKLRATNGRTEPEAAAFERMADKLEAKLR
jgi:hypothetical protein